MAHFWVRAEQRAFEQRVPVSPEGVAALLANGHHVTVEESEARAIGIEKYQASGCKIAPADSWADAPSDVVVLGLKELDVDGPDLKHRHIMFGHAYKGQTDGPQLLSRFKRAGGTLLDLEYLTQPSGRRVAAFGYWAGYAGAAVGLMAWLAQQNQGQIGPVGVYSGKDTLLSELSSGLKETDAFGITRPRAIIIGAKGRVGSGAAELCTSMGMTVTGWDIDETSGGGPFPQILEHELFVNCVLSGPDVPTFVPKNSLTKPRALKVIADVSCDPYGPYNPIPIYDQATTFADPVIRVTENPALDVMAIDNLPSMLPVESSEDYANQLLPYLMDIDQVGDTVWSRASAIFDSHIAKL